MPGWRRQFRCRRREVATMTTFSCVAVLCLYSLALTWCVALPHLSPPPDEGVGGRGGGSGSPSLVVDGTGIHPRDPASPVIAARKLHFDPAPRGTSNSNNDESSAPVAAAPASSSSSSSSSSQKGGGKVIGGDGGNSIQRHHRTLQFSHNAGWDNMGIVDNSNNNNNNNNNNIKNNNNGPKSHHKGVKTMHQKRSRSESPLPGKKTAESSAIYVEESDDSGEDDWDAQRSADQEYRDGDSSSSNNNNKNNNIDPAAASRRGTRRLPGAIIIGVKKAGTRALLEFLRLHPDVQAPGPEPHFFDRNYNRGLDWYKSLMPPTQEGQLTMEKTPSYFITREVPKRVRNMSRDIKLIVVVRDPVTRAISDYVQASSKRGEGRMKRFEDMALLDHRLGIVNTSWGAIRIGVYTKHLERWFKYFPRGQFHFVSGEQLIQDPAQVMKEVQEFLGLRPFITERHFYLNATRGFPCLIKFPENHSKPHCLGKTKGRRHPDVDPGVLQRLRDFYRPFNAKLYQMVGRDFRWS